MHLKDTGQLWAVPSETWEFDIDGGLVVVRPELAVLFTLNHSAAAIWRAYRATGNKERVAEELVERFGIGREVAERDVQATFEGWAASGLLGPARTLKTPSWDGTHGPAITVASITIEGTAFLIETDSQAVIAELTPRLEKLLTLERQAKVTVGVWSGPSGSFIVAVDGECIAIEDDVRLARAVLFQELVRKAQPGRDWLALLHAGGCINGERSVLFPASSHSGKSTLSAALMASGFALLSDDFLGIEANGLGIPPMPFAIALRQGSLPVLKDWIVDLGDRPVHDLYGVPLKFLPVVPSSSKAVGEAATVVFSQWVEGANLSAQRLSTAEVLGRLGQSGFWVRQDRESIGRLVSWLDRVPKFALRYGDLGEAVEWVKTRLREN